MSLNVDNALLRETQGVLGKVYREYTGSLCTAEYSAPTDVIVGDDCLKRTYIYQGSKIVGETTEASTWTQDMEDTLAGTSFLELYSMAFDGVDDQMAGVHSADIDFERTEPFSISFWFKTTSATEQTVISKMGTGTAYKGWRVYLNSAGGVFLELVNDATSGTARIYKQTTSGFKDGQWRHCCITYSGSSTVGGINIYMNAILASNSSGGTLSATITNTVAVRTGSRESADKFFNGRLAEVAIWNKELTVAEVWEIIQGEQNNYTIDHSARAYLINWWRMGNGSTDAYPTIYDQSTSAFGRNDMTMTNMNSSNIVEDSPT